MNRRPLILAGIGLYVIGLVMGIGGMLLIMLSRERDYHRLAVASSQVNQAYGEVAMSRNINTAIFSSCALYALEAKDEAKAKLFVEELLTESMRPLMAAGDANERAAKVLAEIREGGRQSPAFRRCLEQAERKAKIGQ